MMSVENDLMMKNWKQLLLNVRSGKKESYFLQFLISGCSKCIEVMGVVPHKTFFIKITLFEGTQVV